MTRLMIHYCLFTMFLVYYTSETKMNAKDSQNDYFLIFQRMQVAYLNSTFIEGTPTMKFFKYNRTNWAVNMSIHLVKDIDGRLLQDTTSAHVLHSNSYKFTGIRIKANVCKIYETNDNGVRTFFEKYSNINLCYLKKGHKYISNGFIEQWYIPPDIMIPFGNFRLTFDNSFLTGGRLIQLQMFVRSNKYVKHMGRKPNF